MGLVSQSLKHSICVNTKLIFCRSGIWVDAQFRPKKTTHLILDGEIKDDDVNHSAVSCGIHIVSQAYLSDLAKLLQPFTQGNQIQTFSTNFNLPDPTEYLPEPNKEDFEDVRRNRNWWIAKPARAQVWAGKVVVFMSKKNFVRISDNLSRHVEDINVLLIFRRFLSNDTCAIPVPSF